MRSSGRRIFRAPSSSSARAARERTGSRGRSTTLSSRAARPFVRIDAANLSDDLFESELFGHERGAFTGAVSAKRGLLEVADDGTAYLDEVSSLSPAAQAKFLRVLQERTFRRLGGSATHPFRGAPDRVLAARPGRARRRRAPSATTSSTASTSSRCACRASGAAGGRPAARAGVRSPRRARLGSAGAALHADAAEKPCSGIRGPATSVSSNTSSRSAVLTAEGADIEATDLPAGSLGAPETLSPPRCREPLDAERADGRVHRRDAAPRGRESHAGAPPAGRVA